MRIAVTHPTSWPRVRRGTERFMAELARFLTGRGHEVTLISGKPGPGEEVIEGGYRVVRERRWWHPSLARVGVLEYHAFVVPCFRRLVRGRFDVVHTCTFMDGFAANLARTFTGAPYLFSATAIRPPIKYYRALSAGGRFYRASARGADCLVSVSRFVGEFVRREVGRDTTVVPVPVDVDAFRLNRERDHLRPVILCAASLEDERKGGNLLMRAFNEIKRRRPEAQLSISCSLGDSKRAELLSLVAPEWRRDVHVLGAGLHQDLPQLFGRAAVSVLPSRWEGFGMVLLESMATGTPVVGTREGAIPELIDSDDVGRLFDPGPSNGSAPSNVEGCVRALLEALDLSRDPATATRCRAKAEGYSWSRVGPRYEEIYRNLLRERAQAGGRVTEP